MGMIFLDILEFCEPRDVAVNDMIGGEPRFAPHLAPSRNVKIPYRYHLSLLYSSTSIQQAPIDSIRSSTIILCRMVPKCHYNFVQLILLLANARTRASWKRLMPAKRSMRLLAQEALLVCQQNFLKLLTFFHMYRKRTLLCILSKILEDERDCLLHLQRIADSPGSLLANLLPKQFSVFHLERGWSCVSKWLPFRLSVTLMLLDMDLKLIFRNPKSCFNRSSLYSGKDLPTASHWEGFLWSALEGLRGQVVTQNSQTCQRPMDTPRFSRTEPF